YATSRSKLGYEEPRTIPASPPMTTKSTSCRANAWSIGLGSNSACTRHVLADEVRERDAVSEPLVHRSVEALLQQGHVMPVIDRLRVQAEFLAEQVEQVCERRDRRRDDVALDSRDRRLARACARGELRLRDAVAPSRIPEE